MHCVVKTQFKAKSFASTDESKWDERVSDQDQVQTNSADNDLNSPSMENNFEGVERREGGTPPTNLLPESNTTNKDDHLAAFRTGING